MEWTGLNELREKYLSFFVCKGHLLLPRFSLVPQGYKSLLIINPAWHRSRNISQAS